MEIAMPASTKLDLLAGYVTRPTLAEQWNTTPRTIADYEDHGLPNLTLGGRKLYHIESAMDWLKKRQAS